MKGLERLKATVTRFLENKAGFTIFTILTSLVGFLAGLISQPYIERERIDYSMLFEKQAEAFDVLASHHGDQRQADEFDALARHYEDKAIQAVQHMKDAEVAGRFKQYSTTFEELAARAQADSMREWRRARVLIASYGHPDQVRALYDYIATKWRKEITSCEPPDFFDADVKIYQRFREQLFRGEDELEDEEARKKLALIVHHCNLHQTSSASSAE